MKYRIRKETYAVNGKEYCTYIPERKVLIFWNYMEIQEYGYGHVANVVWFGTRQAIKDIRFAK